MFTRDYKISMPLSGVAASTFERDGKGFAFMDYEVKKGLKWHMTFYADKDKKDAMITVDEQKLSLLAGQSGYEFKNAQTGEVLGTWVPKKRFLNLFLRAPYELYVDGKLFATSLGEGFFKLLIPGAIRKMIARKVITAEGAQVAKIRAVSTLGCGVVTVKPNTDDAWMTTAIAVLAAICGVQDV